LRQAVPGRDDSSSRPPARPTAGASAARRLTGAPAPDAAAEEPRPGSAAPENRERTRLVELNARRRHALEQLRSRPAPARGPGQAEDPDTPADVPPQGTPAAASGPAAEPAAARPALNDMPIGSALERASPRPADAATRRFAGPPIAPLPPSALGPRPAAPAAGRQPDPFWKIWLEHREHLRRQSLRLMSGNQADAEDALSAAMLKASQKFAEYADSIVNERAWLSRLLHNACMDVYRAQRKQARWIAEQPVGEEEGEAASQPVAATERSPEELALSREQLAQLQDEVVKLPASLRRPFLMRFVQNLSYDEIAGELELTNAAVRKRIQLARERLRRGLSW
jgi:RNA polymerase sigma-70 factor (ECF subfamily)